MKKNGFTLVELLAVIVILGLLIAIAVPSALKLSNKVKEKSYSTKIDLIEQAAMNFGQSNLSLIKKGASLVDTSKSFTCKMTYDGDNITDIVYSNKAYNPTATLAENEFWCTKVLLEDLVDANDLDWDEEGVCPECSDQKNYNNVIVNPATNYIMNKCVVYVYYKYNRVYAVFDKKKCDIKGDTPIEGNSYRRVNG